MGGYDTNHKCFQNDILKNGNSKILEEIELLRSLITKTEDYKSLFSIPIRGTFNYIHGLFFEFRETIPIEVVWNRNKTLWIMKRKKQ
jgi:hypothetical protein